jgi:hypothetical protein
MVNFFGVNDFDPWKMKSLTTEIKKDIQTTIG